MHKQNENFNKVLEHTKKCQTNTVELKNTVITTKKFNIGFQQQTGAQKKRVGELKDSSYEIIHLDKQKE